MLIQKLSIKPLPNRLGIIYLTNKEALALYNTVIKHDRHLRTRGKCRKHECSQTAGVIYHSIIHGLGFFICFMI